MAHSTEFWPPTVSGFASEHHNDAQSRRCRGSDVEHLNRAFRSYGHFRKYRSCDPLLSQLISRNIMTVAVSSPLVRSVRGPREPAIGTRLSSPGTRLTLWLRYLLYGQTPQATSGLRGRPLGVAKAPCSLARSWRMGWTRMTFPSQEICTEPATMATSTWRRPQLRPTR